jgi:dTDP-4-dehydrorhamnose reductase
MKKKLFVLGIGGLTGHKIISKIKNDFKLYGSYNLRNPNLDFVTSFKLDITNIKKVEEVLFECNPDYIINTCAINNVDYCESHPNEAKKINGDFVSTLSKISEHINCKFVHLSTDSVFDGNKKIPYVETDTTNPNNIYGNTKLMGEKFALTNSNNLVVRASVLYGMLPENISQVNSSSMKPLNFGLWLINKLKSNEKVQIIQDEFSSPIIVEDFANSIIHLLKGNYSGIFHSAPNICINRYDFSKEIAKSLDLDLSLIKPISNKTLGRNVKTGINKCLDSTKMQTLTKFKFLTLTESISLLKNLN